MYKKSIILPFEQSKEDERGYIKSIINQPSTNTSIIMCMPGSVRANHYHLRDWHYMYILEGSMDYFFFDNELNKVSFMSLKKDQIVYTPPKEVHATYFSEETKLIVISYLARDEISYEADTRRVSFINLENMALAKQGELLCQFPELK
jgi:oxalate decarboxylase/phosphoglucose isomerase-like protein (cupin superfamily)